MNRDKLNTGFPILKDFILYCETIKGKSEKTAEEYFSDLKLLFKFLKQDKGLVSSSLPFEEITVNDIDIDFIKGITISDLYAFIVYCKDERQNGAASRARKVSTISTFFKYLTNTMHLLEKNPALELKQPKLRKSLPVHLSLEQCLELLRSIDGPNKERDFAIITLFLNCGMRLSELCSINYTDIKPDGSLKILGKGNKERLIYLNNACQMAVEAYMKVRPVDGIGEKQKPSQNQQQNRSAHCVYLLR